MKVITFQMNLHSPKDQPSSKLQVKKKKKKENKSLEQGLNLSGS
jgi:hypothetical protein